MNKKSIQKVNFSSLRIVVMGDQHVGIYKGKNFLTRATQRANTLDADIILLSGDFLLNGWSDMEDLEGLRGLKARLGVFAVLGNHDAGRHRHAGRIVLLPDRSDDVTQTLRSMGVTVLRNEHRIMTHGENRFAIAGIDDIWMPSSDLTAALENIPHETPLILLAHNPDVILCDEALRADIIVSGHTHGGQIRLPLIGSLSPIPDRLGRAYDQGIFEVSDRTTLAITHGIGESGVRARLFCLPEIMILDINKKTIQ